MAKKWTKPMTRPGFKRIAEEHRHLLEDVRPGVVEGIAIAAAEGDRSENAEYVYGKKRLRELDKRLRYLTSLLKDVEVVDIEYLRNDRVDFGATVLIRNEDGVEKSWTIVGVGEAEVERGEISFKSPLAKVLMGKKVGDYAELDLPAGPMEYELLEVSYGQSAKK